MPYLAVLHSTAQPSVTVPVAALVVFLAIVAFVLGGKVNFSAGPFQVTVYKPERKRKRKRSRR